MSKEYFEEFAIGDTTRSIGRTVSESDIYQFAGLSGAYGQPHTNKAYMERTEYGRRLAQGILLLTYLTGFTTKMPWDPATIALYGLDHVRFVAPVFIGDTVHLELTVKDREERGDDRGLVRFDARIVTEDGTDACVCDWLLLVERRPD